MEIFEILKTIGIFIGALMILVFIHELGHFLAAKAFGMKVDRFSVGFPPRIWGFKYKETDYCIGATPLGGYVKIAGMVDESMDTEFLNKEPEPWEYRSKPVWQRIIVITAGVIFNMILAFFIFSGMTMVNGKLTLPLDNVDGVYVPETSLMYEMGFRTDDHIVGVNGQAVTTFEELVSPAVITSSNLTYQVIRDGQEIDIPVSSNYLDSLQTRGFIGVEYALPSIVSSVSVGNPAHEAGLRAGDKFIAADSVEVKYWMQLTSIIRAAEGEINFTVQRGDSIFNALITPQNQIIGIAAPDLAMSGGEHIRLGFLASIGDGWNQTIEQTTGILGGFARMVSGDISVRQNLGGPIAIANITKDATDRSGWDGFWTITALLSITLAIMNILPIPALDGGHLVFLIYEGITRREPSEKFKIIAQNVGFFMLLTLMVFVIFNDVLKYF
ncbi:MAG: RIP metalloprotease RseP [Balneolales bacterium]|nr:RIP metalloprotease RseP [Balneolales bacterium]